MAVAVGHHAGFVVTVDEAVVQGIGTGRRQAFHQVRAPSGRDDVPRLGIFEQVEAAFAVAPPGDLVEEVGPGEVDDASQYADHRALLVADRHGHAEDGCLQRRVDAWRADRRLAFVERAADRVEEVVVDTDAARRLGHLGERDAVGTDDDHTAGKLVEQDRSVVEKAPYSDLVGEQIGVHLAGGAAEGREQPFEFAVGFGGHEGDGGKLLFGQELVNVVAQPVADEELERPDAGEENEQRKQRYARFQRALAQRFHAHGERRCREAFIVRMGVSVVMTRARPARRQSADSAAMAFKMQ